MDDFKEFLDAVCHVIHLAGKLGATQAGEKDSKLYSRQEAAKFVTCSLSRFDRAKKDGFIEPSMIIGKRGHRYSQADLLALREHLATSSAN